MTLTAYTDGASRGNPGEAGIGVLIQDEDGTTIDTVQRYLGLTTNNVAEYTALLFCLEKIETLIHRGTRLECKRLNVYSDSELMVRQLTGVYKVKDSELKVYHGKVHRMIREARYQFSIHHIPRSRNREADRLANEAIDRRL